MAKHRPQRIEDLDLKSKVAKEFDYKRELDNLQDLMVRIQGAVFQQQRRVLLVFEGCDAAGKGGAIRRLTEKLDPRGFVVHPIGPPRPDEQGRHYLYRFWRRLPKPGHIAIFDRSWYGRVLVERVEKLAPKDALKRAYDEINAFERMLTDDGALIIKLYVHISSDEQLARFAERIRDPYKRWKISDDDVRNRENWPAYAKAADKMFEKTSTDAAPWHLVAGDHKWHARLEVLRIVTDVLKSHLDLSLPMTDMDKLSEITRRLGLEDLLPLASDP
jgi:PPK2 family polyphosphate:nucleotide phosphotransferase